MDIEQRGGWLRPRERMRQLGEGHLSDAECLALLIGTGSRGRSAEELGLELLRRFGGIGGLAAAEVWEVADQPGIGPARAAALGAAFGLARRLAAQRCRPGASVRTGADVARLVREATRGLGRESFWVLLLDARHRVLGLRQVSLGGLQSAPVHPREVFGPALRARAAALVVAHNHPSGDHMPSHDDRRVTERLQEVGAICGIELLDHVVVGGDRYYSFADESEHPLEPLGGGSC